MKVNALSIFIIILIILVFDFSLLKAQSLERQTISSTGSSIFSEGTLIRQTIGQPYNTSTNYSNNITYRPGFQQPIFKTTIIRNNLSLKVFPNPAAEYLTIESSSLIKNATITIIDNAGKLVFTDKLELLDKYQLNCSIFANGAYFVSVYDDNGKYFSAKLIIQR